MKHIEVKYHVLRELREKSLCKFEHIETKLQRADFATKQMDHSTFNPQMNMLYNK